MDQLSTVTIVVRDSSGGIVKNETFHVTRTRPDMPWIGDGKRSMSRAPKPAGSFFSWVRPALVFGNRVG